MGIPILNGCCCCCSLKTGTMVLAVLGIIGAVLNIVQWLSGNQSAQLEAQFQELKVDPETASTYVLIMMICSIIIDIIHGVVSSLLLVAVRKDDVKFMKVYVLWGLITVVLLGIATIAGGVLLSAIPVAAGAFAVTLIIVIVIQLYYLWVVYSYMKTTQNQTINAVPLKNY